MRKILIDTDPGIDDAMAIHLAFAHPDLEVVGLTTVFGNVLVVGEPVVCVIESGQPALGPKPQVSLTILNDGARGKIEDVAGQARICAGRVLEEAGDGVCAFVVAVEPVIGARPDMAVPVFEQLGNEVTGNTVRPLPDHPLTGTVETQHPVIERAEPEESVAILDDDEAWLAADIEHVLELHRRGRCFRCRCNGQP